MARPTKDEMPALGASRDDLRNAIRRVEDQLRGFGLGKQADALQQICDVMAPPTFEGALAELRLEQAWVTRDLALWMAECIMEAAEIMSELMDDAEITGSDAAFQRARSWLERMGLLVTD